MTGRNDLPSCQASRRAPTCVRSSSQLMQWLRERRCAASLEAPARSTRARAIGLGLGKLGGLSVFHRPHRRSPGTDGADRTFDVRGRAHGARAAVVRSALAHAGVCSWSAIPGRAQSHAPPAYLLGQISESGFFASPCASRWFPARRRRVGSRSARTSTASATTSACSRSRVSLTPGTIRRKFRRSRSWLRAYRPVSIVGTSIRLYHIAADDEH
jgi:hypothetical protein